MQKRCCPSHKQIAMYVYSRIYIHINFNDDFFIFQEEEQSIVAEDEKVEQVPLEGYK